MRRRKLVALVFHNQTLWVFFFCVKQAIISPEKKKDAHRRRVGVLFWTLPEMIKRGWDGYDWYRELLNHGSF